MWTYQQSTGALARNGEPPIGHGYSGAGNGKNNPALENVHDVGPIPRGDYAIGSVINWTAVHGKFVMALTPDKGNRMYGRFGFLIHGDSLQAPGRASEGCVILDRQLRNQIAASGDFQLRVTL